jgi:hypothetical protein
MTMAAPEQRTIWISLRCPACKRMLCAALLHDTRDRVEVKCRCGETVVMVRA